MDRPSLVRVGASSEPWSVEGASTCGFTERAGGVIQKAVSTGCSAASHVVATAPPSSCFMSRCGRDGRISAGARRQVQVQVQVQYVGTTVPGPRFEAGLSLWLWPWPGKERRSTWGRCLGASKGASEQSSQAQGMNAVNRDRAFACPLSSQRTAVALWQPLFAITARRGRPARAIFSTPAVGLSYYSIVRSASAALSLTTTPCWRDAAPEAAIAWPTTSTPLCRTWRSWAWT